MAADLAPIAVFAYRRPEHLRHCLESLRNNPEAERSPLVVFCDGSKGAGDADDVAQVRDIAHGAAGFSSVRVIEAPLNQGLAQSIIAGVTQVLSESDTVIVIEDDLVVSPDFLSYMNQGLSLYHDDPRVVSIHGFLPAVSELLPASFFLRGADCWGWATWRRGWAVFDPDGASLLVRLRASPDRDLFDFGRAYPYMEMLESQVRGEIDSWAIRWYASAFLAGLFTLYPGVSLVANEGMEGSGTHSGVNPGLESQIGRFTLPLQRVPVVDDAAARAAIAAALRRRPPVWRRLPARLLGRRW